MSIIDRFMCHVRASSNGCWEWTAGTNGKGYGLFWEKKGTTRGAHRYAYIAMIGDVPDGMQLDHVCRNRKCVNPLHLEPVTARENVVRGNAGRLIASVRTHCPHGHEFSEENTIRYRNCRKCRTCIRDGSRARRLAAKAQKT